MNFIRCCLIFFLLNVPGSVRAQWKETELHLLGRQSFPSSEFETRKPDFLFKNSPAVLKYNPVSLFFGGLLFFYQKTVSPQISVDCPYEINCSNFSKMSIRNYGILKGVALTADRLTRCTPYTLIDLRPIQLSRKNKIIDSLGTYHFHTSE